MVHLSLQFQLLEEPMSKGYYAIPHGNTLTLAKEGLFNIKLDGKEIGEVSIATSFGQTYVSVTLVDTFLTIREITHLMDSLKYEFGLPENQRISFEQI